MVSRRYPFFRTPTWMRLFSLCAFVMVSELVPTTAVGQSRPGAIGNSANSRSETGNWQFRYELFQMLLEERGLSVETSLTEALKSPKESVIVVFGNSSGNDVASPQQIQPFIAQGGTALLSSDKNGRFGNAASFGSTLINTDNEATQYQQVRDCLRITDLDHSHPLMNGVNEIIANRTGWLSLFTGGTTRWQTVAKVPETCSPIRSRGQALIAVGKEWSPQSGTLVLAADPSLFTNSMMWHGDNAILAIRMSDLLCQGERKRLVMMVDGRAQSSYRTSPLLQEVSPPPTPPVPNQPPPPSAMPPMNQPPPKPTWEQLLRVANSVIRNMEESNILNEALINHPRRPNPRLYPLVILMILGGIVAAWLLSKWKHTAAIRPALPNPRTMFSAQEMTKEEKEATLINGQAAQTLARDFCHELTGSRYPSDWEEMLADPTQLPFYSAMKKVHRRDLATLVQLATQRDDSYISQQYLEQVGRMIRELRTLHRESLTAVQSEAVAGY